LPRAGAERVAITPTDPAPARRCSAIRVVELIADRSSPMVVASISGCVVVIDIRPPDGSTPTWMRSRYCCVSVVLFGYTDDTPNRQVYILKDQFLD
jgi:hypothetical protein